MTTRIPIRRMLALSLVVLSLWLSAISSADARREQEGGCSYNGVTYPSGSVIYPSPFDMSSYKCVGGMWIFQSDHP